VWQERNTFLDLPIQPRYRGISAVIGAPKSIFAGMRGRKSWEPRIEKAYDACSLEYGKFRQMNAIALAGIFDPTQQTDLKGPLENCT
jgi:hypothetical protein